MMLLLMSGDVSMNPGPPRTWKYPCRSCQKPVKSNRMPFVSAVPNTPAYRTFQDGDALASKKKAPSKFDLSVRELSSKQPAFDSTMSKRAKKRLNHSNYETPAKGNGTDHSKSALTPDSPTMLERVELPVIDETVRNAHRTR